MAKKDNFEMKKGGRKHQFETKKTKKQKRQKYNKKTNKGQKRLF